jgi:hypothetical protein
MKATSIERGLRLQQHSEPGLCRRDLLEDFAFLRNSSGVLISFSMAKKMGHIPPDATVEDFMWEGWGRGRSRPPGVDARM